MCWNVEAGPLLSGNMPIRSMEASCCESNRLRSQDLVMVGARLAQAQTDRVFCIGVLSELHFPPEIGLIRFVGTVAYRCAYFL